MMSEIIYLSAQTMQMRLWSRSGFTLVEIVLVIMIFSIGLISVFQVITQGTFFSNRTRYEVIAVNIAREWAEGMYTIRDTNRVRRAWKRDQCRLKSNPLSDTAGDGCENDTWIQSWAYLIVFQKSGNQIAPLLSGTYASRLSLVDGIQTSDRNYALCIDAEGFRYQCPGVSSGWIVWGFFRTIEVNGLYDKFSDTTWGTLLWSCLNGSSPWCGSSSPKELIFCSRVEYLWGSVWRGQSQLCSSLTNFVE
jgi:prepilin-type N-terminal cleavage/methylation domain-containing protein